MANHSLDSTVSPTQTLSDEAIALLRTVVPLGWGFAASWLIGLGVPAGVLDAAHSVVISAGTAVLSTAWYAAWRWLQPRIPPWLVAVALGYPAAPTYASAASSSDTPGPGTGLASVPGSTLVPPTPVVPPSTPSTPST